MKKAIVLVGNPLDGFMPYGPFDDAVAATEWAEKECDSDDWWVVNLEPGEYLSIANIGE